MSISAIHDIAQAEVDRQAAIRLRFTGTSGTLKTWAADGNGATQTCTLELISPDVYVGKPLGPEDGAQIKALALRTPFPGPFDLWTDSVSGIVWRVLAVEVSGAIAGHRCSLTLTMAKKSDNLTLTGLTWNSSTGVYGNGSSISVERFSPSVNAPKNVESSGEDAAIEVVSYTSTNLPTPLSLVTFDGLQYRVGAVKTIAEKGSTICKWVITLLKSGIQYASTVSTWSSSGYNNVSGSHPLEFAASEVDAAIQHPGDGGETATVLFYFGTSPIVSEQDLLTVTSLGHTYRVVSIKSIAEYAGSVKKWAITCIRRGKIYSATKV